MELFKTLDAVLSQGEDATIVIRKKDDGKFVVSVLVSDSGLKDEAQKHLQPFVLKGTPDELDEGFLEAISAPVKESAGLLTSMKSFEKGKEKAEKESAAAKAKKAADDKRAEEEKKKADRKAEADRKKAEKEAEKEKMNPTLGFSEEPAAEPENDPAEPESAPEPAEPAEVPSEESAPAPEQTVAPTAKEVVKEDIYTIWNRAKKELEELRYKDALADFEKCRMVAVEKQYPAIDKAIALCHEKMGDSLFN